MATTYTVSDTESYSEPEVKAVMKNAYEDIIGFANRDIITYTRAKGWIEDIILILNRKCLNFYEIQLHDKNNKWIETIRYDVVLGGFFSTSASGGIDYYKYPDGTKAVFYADINWTHDNAQEVNRVLHEERNWGFGSASIGTAQVERNYVSGNLALQRSLIK